MARSSKKRVELGEAAPLFGTVGQKQVERLLKQAAEQAAKDAKRRWEKTGRNPFAKQGLYTTGAFEQAFRDALKGALTHHANNSGPRPSIKMTAPDTGGRPFHFSHTNVNASGASWKYKAGTTAAHMSYIDRDSAVEQAMLEEGVDLTLASREIDSEAGFERDPADRMQAYIDDAEKVEAAKAAAQGEEAKPLAFSFGNIGDTREERSDFWELVEKHPERGNARLQSRVILELPVESTPAQRLDIVKRYVKGLEERGLRYHAALHAPTDKNDPRNFHAHVIYMARPAQKVPFAFDGLEDGSGKPKGLVWDFAAITKIKDEFRMTRERYLERQSVDPDTRSKKFIPDERKRLAGIVNDVMHEAGNPVRYDARSYKAMGLEVEALRSISRIVADKAKNNKCIVLDEGRTKRDVEAEVQRLARERAPEFSEISKIRAAVRGGDRELRQLEKEGAFLKNKPILRRGVHAVKTFVKRKALDYARTRGLHVERSIEAAQEVRSIERVIEATNPEIIAQLRDRLAASLNKARGSGNVKEVARLKKDFKVVPKTAHAAILNSVARKEVETLKDRHASRAAIRLAKVRQAMRDWRAAALGARPEPMATVNPSAIRSAGVSISAGVQAPAQVKPQAPKEHPMWASYDQVVDEVFKTGFQKFMWGVIKRYGQFILENADPDVPGRTPIELADKLVEAIKQHPAKAEEMMMSYQNGRQVPQPGQARAPAPPASAEPVPPSAPPIAEPAPVFKQKARIPRPAPGTVEAFPYDLTPIERAPSVVAADPATPPPVAEAPAKSGAQEPQVPEITPLEGEITAKPKRKERNKRKERQRGILRGRVLPDRS